MFWKGHLAFSPCFRNASSSLCCVLRLVFLPCVKGKWFESDVVFSLGNVIKYGLFLLALIVFLFLSFLADMDVLKVSKFSLRGGRKAEWQRLWILWTSKVRRRHTTLSTKWEIETYGRIIMNQEPFPVLLGDWMIQFP